jgi:hypothetical protein
MWSAIFEAANVRHEHEWRLWQNSKIPEQKTLMPGVEINLFRPAGRARYECRPLGHVGRCSSVMISSGRRRAGGKSLAVRRTKSRRRL